jgi:hypothetical protein
MRPYVLLLAAALAAGVLLGLVARRPGRGPIASLPAPAPQIELELVVDDGGLRPGAVSVPQGRSVDLRVRNASARAIRLTLAGYEDRVRLPSLGPGQSERTAFLADRPGEDFAWLVDGRPAGRFHVSGSHLVEGHR